ncbi:MAG: septal ring lytic transglycosylase RlpA family protein [Hyphomicrobiales bacterium]|nr:septal ring lytic transglycosylase RlpA family protein [Hyphomicrobiales bacterium]MDE2114069.1 septal ring lytic transglycosylase RlpA family protein [Hyphomicrobiales bacterium]
MSSVSLPVFMAGCASNPQQMASTGGHFTEAKYGVPSSPRVVAAGQKVPVGGGKYFVGKPYTVAGRTYYPAVNDHYSVVGMASWYGSDFHGRRTANGEVFDKGSVTAASRTMPLPSYARVTNLRNNKSMIVRVNDRGPFARGRVMDVSERVASALDFKRAGTARVKVEYVGHASLKGSDSRMLMATLSDGVPAQLNGGVNVGMTRFASNEPAPGANVEAPQTASRTQGHEQLALAYTNESRSVDREPVMSHDSEQASLVRDAGAHMHVPMPPERPFDLDTIPGASDRIGAGSNHAKLDKVSYYKSGPIGLSDHFEKVKPFAASKPHVLQPLTQVDPAD